MPRAKGYHDPLQDVTPRTYKEVAKRIIQEFDRDDALKIRGRILDEIGVRLKHNDARSVRAMGLRALDARLKEVL
jgi:hypothetical protein